MSADELEAGLSRWAQRSADSRGRERPEEPCSLRTPYQRDRDRIVHCKSFRRLKHKTQVFIAPEGDHYRTRLTHTLEVAGIARTIARALRLNEDLTEAIALGHDLGHTPFGHAGEKVMRRDAARSWAPAVFKHNEQSARVVEVLENDGRGLNLTWEVRDGIRHHTGDAAAGHPRGADRALRRPHRLHQPRHRRRAAGRPHHPGRSALRARSALLGETGSDRIDALVHDLVDASYETGDHRPEPGDRRGDGRAARLPLPDGLSAVPAAGRRAARPPRHHQLMQYFLEHPEEMGTSRVRGQCAAAHARPAGRRPAAGAPATTAATAWQLVQAVTDYISGMTDRYAISRYRELFDAHDRWAGTP